MTKVPQQVINNLLRFNRKRLHKQVAHMTETMPDNAIVVAMDFDECAMVQHTSRLITERYIARSPIPPGTRVDNTVHGILQLFHCYVGIPREEFVQTVREVVAECTWRAEFDEYFPKLSAMPQVVPVFISSGISEAVEACVERLKLPNTAKLADRLLYDQNGHITGPYTIVGQDEKGELVRMLRQSNKVKKLIAVGHSGGDVDLIKAGDAGYRLTFGDAPETIPIANQVITSWLEVLPLVD